MDNVIAGRSVFLSSRLEEMEMDFIYKATSLYTIRHKEEEEDHEERAKMQIQNYSQMTRWR